jgi:urease accessory protein UreF
MNRQTYSVPSEAAPWLGDPQPLLERLGPAEETAAPALAQWAIQLRGIRSVASLRSFIRAYRAELLVPVELPAIVRARSHAVRNELRELIALDAQLAAEPKMREFAAASFRVGQRQLSRLRPLRDQRLVRRYREAVERGEARGWHTLVYGVSLVIYSLPLRQGLLAYAWHTLGGFIASAARPLALTAGRCAELQAEACEPLPEAVQHVLRQNGSVSLRVL